MSWVPERVVFKVHKDIPELADEGDFVVVSTDGKPRSVSVVKHHRAGTMAEVVRHASRVSLSFPTDPFGRTTEEVLRLLCDLLGIEASTDAGSIEGDDGEAVVIDLLSRLAGSPPAIICGEPTDAGNPCRRKTGGGVCWQHEGAEEVR